MENAAGNIIGLIFFSLCLISTFYLLVLNPERAIKFQVKWSNVANKFMGLKGTLETTPKSIKFTRIWGIFMMICFSVLIYQILSGKFSG